MKRAFSGQNVVKIVEMRKTTGKMGRSGRGQSRIFFFFFFFFFVVCHFIPILFLSLFSLFIRAYSLYVQT